MREFILIAGMTLASLLCFADNNTTSTVKDPETATIEFINDSTVVYNNVDCIEITQTGDHLVYIFDKETSKLVAANHGTFKVNLTKGDYLVVSTKPFTKVDKKVIVERITL